MTAEERATALGERLSQLSLTLAVAESLTAGNLSTRFGAVEGSGEWFRGGVVAYASEVKFEVLHVSRGPVVSARCAMEMARGVKGLLASDIGIAVTGVGGPGPDEGQPAGTVFIAVQCGDELHEARLQFGGDPEAVLAKSIDAVIELTLAALRRPLHASMSRAAGTAQVSH